MSETIEVIHTNNYGKVERFKTKTRDPVKEALRHINDKYFQSTTIKEEIEKE